MDDIHSAIGQPDELRRLLAAGAQVEARNDWDCTPLFHAVVQGDLRCVELLIAAGANVNAHAGEPGCDILADTPLNLAKQCQFLMDRVKYAPIVEALEAAGAKERR